MLIVEALKNRGLLVRWAKGYLANKDDAEDVVQDVCEYFLSARMPRGENKEETMRLLRWYVKNRCINLIKSRLRRREQENKLKENERGFISGEIYSGLEIETVVKGLNKVDYFARELFVLTKMDGYTIDDVAEATGINRNRLNYINLSTKNYLKNLIKDLKNGNNIGQDNSA